MPSLPNVSITENATAIRAARLAFCDSPIYDSAQISSAAGTVLFFLIALMPYLATFPGTWRLCRRYSTAFCILLYINILHCFLLALYAVPSMEYLAGTRFIKIFPVDVFLLFLFGTSMARLYILLAFNRTMAIFSVFTYNRIFSRKRINVYVTLIILTALASCIFAFYNPETRYYNCVATMHRETPTYHIKEYSPILAAVMTHWNIAQLINGVIPMLFYAIALAKLFIDPCSSSGSSSAATSSITQLHSYQKQSRELWPLYTICLLGSLPIFMVSCISILRSHKVLGEEAIVINDMFGWLHNAQQPWLMLLLSRDMRAELCADMKRARCWIRRCCATKSNSVQPLSVAGIVVVTNLQHQQS